MTQPSPITVLMPVFNAARYVGQALESILAQSFADFTCLVIDDGSTDGSAEVVGGYDDPRIDLVINGRNQGLIATLNQGVERARSEYIVRMDQDDIALPKRLEKQWAFLHAHPEVGICGSWVRTFGDTNDTLWKYPQTHDDIQARLLFASSLAHPTVMMRQRIFDKVRYDPGFPSAEDYRLWVEACRFTRLANLPEPLLRYRLHGTQIGRARRDEQVRSATKIWRALLGLLGLQPSAEDLQSHADIARPESGLAADRLAAAADWMLRLKSANEQTQVYDDNALGRTIADRWWNLCCQSSLGASSAWSTFKRHPVSGRRQARLLDQARFLRGRWGTR